MDVNVKDVNEIVCFGRSLQSFLAEYLNALNAVRSGAEFDRAKAYNIVNKLRTKMEKAERDVQSASISYDSTVRSANSHPDEDWSEQIEHRARQLEEAAQNYADIKEACQEAESLYKKVKASTDRVIEEAYRSQRQINEVGRNALQSIQTSAQKIMQYLKTRK